MKNNKKINLNTLARIIALREGKKKSVSIAQVKEILKITLQELSNYTDVRIWQTINRYKNYDGNKEKKIKFRMWDIHEKKVGYFDFYSTNLWTKWHSRALNEDIIVLNQYTGLKDETGKEIYEGDIICANDKWILGSVIFKDGSFRYCDLKTGKPVIGICASLNFSRKINQIKIIGNIYENEDLLKKCGENGNKKKDNN